MKTKILKTMVASEGGLFLIDTIEYEGELWLVPEWTDNPTTKRSKPVRIICLTYLPVVPAPDGSGNFRLGGTLPKSVLDGHAPPGQEERYYIVENPEIEVDTPDEEPTVH